MRANEWRNGHVPEPGDLMYAGDAPWAFPLTLDIGRDDYYGAVIPGCRSLESSGFLKPRQQTRACPPAAR